MSENTMLIIWAALIIVFGVLEAATAQLVSIWFVIGAIAALVAALFDASLTVQIIVFIAVTILALVATRPIVKKFVHAKKQPTNADRVLNQTGIVIEEINNIKATGQVKVDGKVWSAKSADDSIIPVNEQITIKEISGVKLIVEKETVLTH